MKQKTKKKSEIILEQFQNICYWSKLIRMIKVMLYCNPANNRFIEYADKQFIFIIYVIYYYDFMMKQMMNII